MRNWRLFGEESKRKGASHFQREVEEYDKENTHLCRPFPSTGDQRRQMSVFFLIVPSPEQL